MPACIEHNQAYRRTEFKTSTRVYFEDEGSHVQCMHAVEHQLYLSATSASALPPHFCWQAHMLASTHARTHARTLNHASIAEKVEQTISFTLRSYRLLNGPTHNV
eukprot:6184207-Pleurochrysis_carterae.AAC.2